MLNNQDFTHNRTHFLGGSDIGAILGVSKYRSAMDVWLEKTGKKREHKDSFALRFGSYAEDFIANEYAFMTGETLVHHSEGLIHPQYAYCVGHIDRFVMNKPSDTLLKDDGTLNAKKLLECKTANQFTQRDWGEAGTDSVPLPYLCQSLWYLGITGLTQIDVAVLFAGADLKIYSIEKDLELEALLFEKAAFFWSEHVQKDIPPKPQSQADCQALFSKAHSGKVIEATHQTVDLITQLRHLESNAHENELQIDQIKQTLMQTMGDAETLLYQGKPLITWKAPKPSMRLDAKRLALDHPELVSQYQTFTANSRRFVIKDWDQALISKDHLHHQAAQGVNA